MFSKYFYILNNFFKVWSSDSKFSCRPQVGSFEVWSFEVQSVNSPTELSLSFHMFLFTLTIFQSLKFRFEFQSLSSQKLGCSKFGRSNDPTWGMTALELPESDDPQLRRRPPTSKIQQWYHNIWRSGIFQRSVFRRSNSVFGLSTFRTFRRWVIWRSVIRCWVPLRRWVLFDVQSFNVGSLFGVGSYLTLSHSVFGHSVLGLSVLGHSMFGHSTFSLSAFSRWIFTKCVKIVSQALTVVIAEKSLILTEIWHHAY